MQLYQNDIIAANALSISGQYKQRNTNKAVFFPKMLAVSKKRNNFRQ
jgi:hypothetical protein